MTLSALGGPALAALPPPPQYLQAGPISQTPVAIPQQSQQAKPADVALKEESQSTSRFSVSQPSAQRSPEIQRDAAADATTQGQSHSAAVSAPADSGSQHEHAVHDVSAGMSLSSEGQQPQQAHGLGTAADRTGTSRSSAYSGIDDPLRRPARNDVEAQHGSQVPVSTPVDSSNACENSLPASEHGRSESGINSAAASGQQAPHFARNAAQQVISSDLCILESLLAVACRACFWTDQQTANLLHKARSQLARLYSMSSVALQALMGLLQDLGV